MTLDDRDLDKVLRTLNNTAAFYLLNRDKSDPAWVVYTSSRSEVSISVKPSGFTVFWDERFFQFMRHLFRALSDPERRIQLPTSRSISLLHIESVIWVALAERSLNGIDKDLPLALGAVLQPSTFLHHSMRVLGPFDEVFEEADAFTGIRLLTFENFVGEHEIAHNAIKRGQLPSEETQKYFVAACNLIDKRLVDLRAAPDVDPAVLELTEAAVAIRISKKLMEEVWADLYALEEAFLGLENTEKGRHLGRSVSTTFVGQGAMYGLTALRLLALANPLRLKDRNQFEESWHEARLQFIGRTTYLETVLALMISQNGDEDSDQVAQIQKLNELSYNLFSIVRTQEFEWRDRYVSGSFDELRADGQATYDLRGFDDISAIAFCGERLGWFRGNVSAGQTSSPSRKLTDKQVAHVAANGDCVHRFRGRTIDGLQAYFFVFVEPENEAAFLEAVANPDEFDVSTFGLVIASNLGDIPSTRVLIYLKERFGFDVGPESEGGADNHNKVDDTTVSLLRTMRDSALRAVMVRALEWASLRDVDPDRIRFKITFKTDSSEVGLPDSLRERYPKELTIVLQHKFEDLTCEEDGFSVRLSFGGEWHRIWVPYLAATQFKDLNCNLTLSFPESNPRFAESERHYFRMALGASRIEGPEETLDYPKWEGRCFQAAVCWIMGASSNGFAPETGQVFRLDLDPLQIPTRIPSAWPRTHDGLISLVLDEVPPGIEELTEPMGWRITPVTGAIDYLVPLRSVRRLSAIAGSDCVTLVLS